MSRHLEWHVVLHRFVLRKYPALEPGFENAGAGSAVYRWGTLFYLDIKNFGTDGKAVLKRQVTRIKHLQLRKHVQPASKK